MAPTVAWMFFLASLATAPSVQDGGQQAPSTGRKRLDATRHARSLIEEADPNSLRDALTFQPAPELDGTVSASGQSFSVTVQATLVSLSPSAETKRIFEVTIHPGVGYTEKFLVAPGSGAGPRPMLVCFHKFGNSAYDILYNTNFFREGINRGWHVVAPLGASTAHFSSLESQVNTEAVMNWMVNPNHFSVDKTRVYAVGFSMGGGAALNYAARHLDPAKVMFAAVVNHTGVVCHEDAYDNEPLSQYIFEFWFGNGTPGYTDPFKMRRSSVITFDPVTLAVETTTDLARNLMHLNTRTLYANQDPLDYLRTENDVLHTHLLSLGAGPAQHVLYVYPGTTHSWDLLDEKITCDWLRTQRLRLPTSGNTLADQNGKYFYFTVTQALGGAFTPFAWELNTTSNTLDISQTANLVELAVDTALSGLSSSAPFTAELSTADGAPDALRLRGWNHLPWSVIRDGVPTSNWSYNATNGDLTLNEFNGAGVHVWLVVP